MTRRLLVLFTALLLTAAGCADGGLSDEAAQDLQQRAAEVRAAAEARDVATAQEALGGLRSALDAHVEDGAVSAGRAREIAGAADAVAARLALLTEEEPEVPPAPEPSPVEEPPPPEPPPTLEDDDDQGRDGDDDRDGDDRDRDRDDDDRDDDGQDEDRDGRGPEGEGPPGQNRAEDP